jgi:hypothetical protein
LLVDTGAAVDKTVVDGGLRPELESFPVKQGKNREFGECLADRSAFNSEKSLTNAGILV